MKSKRFLLMFMAASSMLLLAGWRAPASGAKHRLLPAGDWGGDHVRMTVSASGAELDFDCASGKIAAPIALDAKGNFDVMGEYHAEHAGPIRRDEDQSTANARFQGKLSGDHLTLTITLLEGGTSVGDFALEKGSLGRVFKCR
jgi:hypothetical protein